MTLLPAFGMYIKKISEFILVCAYYSPGLANDAMICNGFWALIICI